MGDKNIFDNTYYDEKQGKYLMALQRKGAFPSPRKFRGEWFATAVKKCPLCKRYFLCKPMQKVCNSEGCRKRWHVIRQNKYWGKKGLSERRKYYNGLNHAKKVRQGTSRVIAAGANILQSVVEKEVIKNDTRI